MKKNRVLTNIRAGVQKFHASDSQLIVFCDQTTGTPHFRAECDRGFDAAVERAAGLLAVHCLVRGQDPQDFLVLVPAEQTVVERLHSRAADLLREGLTSRCPVELSARQKEILQLLLRDAANKEIAAKLNITVRTVKFHVSRLFTKFRVQSRTELVRKASALIGPAVGIDDRASSRDALDSREAKVFAFTSAGTAAGEKKRPAPSLVLPSGARAKIPVRLPLGETFPPN